MPERTPISGWTHVRDVLAEREPRPSQEQVIRDVHALCREWDAGHLPLVEIRKLTTGAERNVAIRFTPPGDPLFAPLMRLFDALIDTAATAPDGYAYTTRQGIFSEQDIREAGGHVERAGAGLRIVFPIRHPWRRRPDPDRGDAGERDAPAFARTPEDRWRIANDQRGPATPAKARKVFE